MSFINSVAKSMNGIKTIETSELIFTDDNSTLNTSAGITQAQSTGQTAINKSISAIAFNTGTGNLTLTTQSTAIADLSVDLDGRYLTSIPTLDADDIPDLPAGKITSDEFAVARIPTLDADKIGTGEFAVARIPTLDADKIGTGEFAVARIPTLDADKIGTGEFAVARIPTLPYVSVGTSSTSSTAETIYGIKTFDKPPVCSTDPTENNQLANRGYVLANAGGSGDAVLDGGDANSPQGFTGVNKFSNTTEFLKIKAKNTDSSITSASINMESVNGNTFTQTSTSSVTTGGVSNQITQTGGVGNRISQSPVSASNGNEILQLGTNSLIKTEGSIAIGDGANFPTFPSNVVLKVKGAMYIDGTGGIRIPRNTYNSPALREWWINQNISSGAGTGALNYLYSNATNGGFGIFFLKHRLNGNGSGQWAGSITGNVNLSDDRLKTNEAYLENATESLLKLSVQTYDKEKVNNFSLLERTGKRARETGVIAQEVYYNAPEFRHLINCGTEYDDEYPEGKDIIPDEMDLSGVPIGEDPDYEGAGWSKTEMASVEYQGFVAYLIKSNQELHERILKLENK